MATDWDDLRAYAFNLLWDGAATSVVPCKICDSEALPFDVLDFQKTCDYSIYPEGLVGVPVVYSRCGECGFVFTKFFDKFQADWWRHFVYNDEYYDRIDPDYKHKRPASVARELMMLLRPRNDVIGLDYGGGSGLLSDFMRNAGYKYDIILLVLTRVVRSFSALIIFALL